MKNLHLQFPYCGGKIEAPDINKIYMQANSNFGHRFPF